jgi:hypothetical protein
MAPAQAAAPSQHNRHCKASAGGGAQLARAAGQNEMQTGCESRSSGRLVDASLPGQFDRAVLHDAVGHANVTDVHA